MSKKSTEPEQKGRGRPATGKTPQRQIRCPDDEWAMFESAAALEDVSVAVWLRKVGVAAAKRRLNK